MEQRELPVDLMELVESIKSVIEEKINWIKCDSKLNWSMSSLKTGEEKEKAAVTINYRVASQHPNVKESEYSLGIKVNLDRMIEISFDGLYFDDIFGVSAKVNLTESQINDIPFLIGKYLDLRTSDKKVTMSVSGGFGD